LYQISENISYIDINNKLVYNFVMLKMSRGLPRGFEAPVTKFDNDEWRLKAECSGEDTEQFFFPHGQGWKRTQKQGEETVDNYCLWCPVMQACGKYAIDSLQYYGVWGGMTENELRDKVDERIVELATEQGLDPSR
jgi:WhiB family transcriptional regulator, redox-sensing transcriptional regulator